MFSTADSHYYYTPISVRDININPNLKQNKFWAE